ncbi:alpha/beta hydrolase (plasmid) [Aliirhizobium terrae]|uniref:alpha/beta hydrolase n=1 Tax=Terrirhizobium terrae TaxID=2926709 RepID=UPI002578F774|nr:alpha/beta hydrolase [Rhizobium sp. CC-CFT758]WJH38438.1 alpha/beta hydrolase [Rhizobium sp. CC-CFT758]
MSLTFVLLNPLRAKTPIGALRNLSRVCSPLVSSLRASFSSTGISPRLAQPEVTGYVADKHSAAFSRDDLATVLTQLSHNGVLPTILAHSMGAWLAVESVRQLSLMGERDVVRSIDQLVLAAPDIDIGLLRKQLPITDRLSKPIVVLASKDDIALALSKGLAGSAVARSYPVDRDGNISSQY